MIRIRNLSKKYGENVIFKDRSFDLEERKTTAIMGKSGLGKTTLLRILMGLEKYDAGSIEELENIGLSGSTEKPVKELSGGMKRRVAIIRSIMADSDIVIFDEPFKGLDVETRKTVIEYLKEKLKDRTVIMVTHDIDEALALNCKIINLK